MKRLINEIVNEYVKFNEAHQSYEMDQLHKYDEAYQKWLNKMEKIVARKMIADIVEKLMDEKKVVDIH